MLGFGDCSMTWKEIFACITLLLAATLPASVDGNLCITTRSETVESKVRRYPMFTKKQLSDASMVECEPDEQCLECLPVKGDVQNYVGYCSAKVERADDSHRCNKELTKPCESESDDSCHPLLTKLLKMKSCSFRYYVQGEMKVNETTFCTGDCSTAEVYMNRKIYLLTGCSKFVEDWKNQVVKDNPDTAMAEFCPNGTNCKSPHKTTPLWTGTELVATVVETFSDTSGVPVSAPAQIASPPIARTSTDEGSSASASPPIARTSTGEGSSASASPPIARTSTGQGSSASASPPIARTSTGASAKKKSSAAAPKAAASKAAAATGNAGALRSSWGLVAVAILGIAYAML